MSLTLAGLTLGLHLASAHFPARDYHNNLNPGVYVVSTEGWTGGLYYNTLRRPSAYFGQRVPLGPIDFTIGAVTGYDRVVRVQCAGPSFWHENTVGQQQCAETVKGTHRFPILPMLAPSIRLGPARLWYLPGIGNASSVVHLSVEWKL